MGFIKYQALGNDYLVVDEADMDGPITAKQAQRICHRNLGIGSDGILVFVSSNPKKTFQVRIINPDGSEAEKSGNGLRIFARYLFDRNLVTDKPFNVSTLGGDVTCRILNNGKAVRVNMGSAVFDAKKIPVKGFNDEVLRQHLEIQGEKIEFSAVSMGNPHCVIIKNQISEKEARTIGPLVENHPFFPNRTNVQFVKVLDRSNIRLEIWERGAGYTLSSGTSSCAAAAVSRRLGLCDKQITAHMPGGKISISFDDQWGVTMEGGVSKVFEATLAPEFYNENKK